MSPLALAGANELTVYRMQRTAATGAALMPARYGGNSWASGSSGPEPLLHPWWTRESRQASHPLSSGEL